MLNPPIENGRLKNPPIFLLTPLWLEFDTTDDLFVEKEALESLLFLAELLLSITLPREGV